MFVWSYKDTNKFHNHKIPNCFFLFFIIIIASTTLHFSAILLDYKQLW